MNSTRCSAIVGHGFSDNREKLAWREEGKKGNESQGKLKIYIYIISRSPPALHTRVKSTTASSVGSTRELFGALPSRDKERAPADLTIFST